MMQRPRRNRKTAAIRALARETRLVPEKLIFPLFLMDGKNGKEEIASLPGIYRYTEDEVLREVESCLKLGLKSFVLFPKVADQFKDSKATFSYSKENFYLKIIRSLKKRFPEICLTSDVALDPYSSDGHDGLVKDRVILNDETLPILAQMAIAQAEAGIDIVGPSDMMDGRVVYLRNALDEAGFAQVSIMSYTAKYASALYGPFRDALQSAPKAGDKKTYQMDPSNVREAEREALLDMAEGADFLMVKPAIFYLDVIQRLKQTSDLPIAAYNVSGEFAMLKAAAMKGWLQYEKVMPEMLLSIARAGSDIILTYAAKDFAQLYKNDQLEW